MKDARGGCRNCGGSIYQSGGKGETMPGKSWEGGREGAQGTALQGRGSAGCWGGTAGPGQVPGIGDSVGTNPVRNIQDENPPQG